MKLFYVYDGQRGTWHGTLAQARLFALGVSPVYRRVLRITECHVRTDKPNVLLMLGGCHPVVERCTRDWVLTPRRALRRVDGVNVAGSDSL